MWKKYERESILQFVPDALQVQTISYQKEKSWGIGAGGRSAGICFYPLSADVASNVQLKGIRYLNEISSNNAQLSQGDRGLYNEWKETPIEREDWKVTPKTGLLDVSEYICLSDIAPDRLTQANVIVSKPGSFYAHGRSGIVVVNPLQKVVLYFYNH